MKGIGVPRQTGIALEIKRLIAIALLAGLSSASLVCAPAIASQLGSQFSYDAQQIGHFFSAEFAGFVISGLLGQRLMPRVAWRAIALVSLLVFLAGTLITMAFLDSTAMLLVLRTITATGGALIGVVCVASANEAANPSRAYGFYIIGQLLAGVVGLALLPMLFARFGLTSFFVVVAVLSLCAAPVTAWLAQGKSEGYAAKFSAASGSQRWRQLRFPALLLFYVALGGIWTFSAEFAKQAGLDSIATGTVLAVATFAGVIGAGVASTFGRMTDMQRPVLIGYVLLTTSSLALLDTGHLVIFVLAVLVFKFAWTFALPFLMAVIGRLDADGRIMAEIYLVAGIGLMVGPLLAGYLASGEQGYARMLTVETVLVGISGLSAVVLSRRVSMTHASDGQMREPATAPSDSGV
jgi:MFS family permease